MTLFVRNRKKKIKEENEFIFIYLNAMDEVNTELKDFLFFFTWPLSHLAMPVCC
jgi:hypothetical protein